MAKFGRPGQGKAIYKELIDRGYVCINDVMYPPSSPEAKSYVKPKKKPSKTIKTGWTDDTRNIANRDKYHDEVVQFIKMELSLDAWPEFYFSVDRQFRLDYAIPEIKIGIEVNGGIWAKGNSGHSSGTGIMRDYEKSNLAQSLGWRLMSVTPTQVKNFEFIKILQSMLNE